MANIFNISANSSFLDVLANGVLERFEDISKVTIFLPTRRAISELRKSFANAAGGKVMLLPKIEALGDIDEEEYFLKRYPETDKIPQAISKAERLARMAKLIEQKQDKLNFNQAMLLAKDFVSLIDEIQNKQIDFENLEKIVPDEFSEHWQKNLEFLKIITEDWQQYKKEHNVLEPMERRNLLLASVVEYLNANPTKDPVIVAGSTGTVPATMQLIEAILTNENGYLVLDGMDENYEDNSFAKLPQNHPQHNLAHMLGNLGASHSDVQSWGSEEFTPRQKLISTAMLPLARIEEWQNFKANTDGLQFIECETIEEEATVISFVMREVLESKNASANLVTNNRDLARRVSAKMKIWNVEVNDSVGFPLSKLPTANFLVQLAEMCVSKFDAIKTLSFFKHPFTPIEYKNKLRKEEHHIRSKKIKIEDFKPWEYGIEIVGLAQFAGSFSNYKINFAEILDEHIKLAVQIAGGEKMWFGKGVELAEYLIEIQEAAKHIGEIDGMLYPIILNNFFATKTYRPDFGAHPRLNIFSPMEARLQNADVTIIGGLNEGDFPQLQQVDAFLNQKMRKDLGLDLPDMKIGQAAHDFELLSNRGRVVYTRSLKDGGSPTIASRFMQSLTTIASLDKGEDLLHWAREFDASEVSAPCSQPQPTPPIIARPKKLSVTKIGKLMRDPYAVYAEKILRLRKLDDIRQDLGPADFGNFVHDSIEAFSKVYDGKLETLLKCGEERLKAYGNKIAIATFWWPRFVKIANWLIEKEQSERDDSAQIFHEIESQYKFGEFELTAKADRVEISDKIKIIDYKTGAVPANSDVIHGLEPQLPLEAVIFCNEYKKPLYSLEYWHIKGNANEDEKVTFVYNGTKKDKDCADIDELVPIAQAGVEKVIADFAKETTPYIATPRPSYALKYNDYEHLARNREWSS